MNNITTKNQPLPSVVQNNALSSVPQGLSITHDVRMRQAQAQIMSQYQMALMLPRVWESISAKLLLACDNPDFAKEAYYKKPAGREFIEGLSVRFAEHALTLMRNISVDCSPEMEDEFSAHYRVTVLDIESNTPSSETFKVEKTVERQFVSDGDTIISQRTNSQGRPVFLIPATEDQFNTKLRAQMSKVRRTLLLALIPAEIRSACLERCKAVVATEDAKDPAGEAKRIIMAFIGVGIDVPDLKEYLGKSPANATPKEVESLRLTFGLIRDGEITWRDVMAAKAEREAEQGSKAAFVAQKEKEKAAKAKTKPPRAGAAEKAPRGGNKPPTEAKGDAATTTTPEAPARATRASRRDDDEEPVANGAATVTDPTTSPS